MTHLKHLFREHWRLCAGFAFVILLGAVPPSPVRADDGNDDGPKVAPRSVVKIGGVSVVLIAANDRLYAFVDRISDNAPASDARLTVSPAAAAPTAKLDMKRATAGLFVAPFNRTGHLRDAFTVSVRSASGTGQETAELVYDDLPKQAQKATSGLEAFIALVAGALGAAIALAIVWFRQSRRRPGETIGKPRAA
jgi:hypothetical protein